MLNRGRLALILLLAVLLLTGCSPTTIDELYSPPKRSAAFEELQNAIDGAMQGLEYCAPLTGENQQELLIPAGCAHGYLVLENSVVSYKCGEKFYGEYDDGIAWNDPDIGVAWPLEKIGGESNLIIADKDKNLQSFRQLMERYHEF